MRSETEDRRLERFWLELRERGGGPGAAAEGRPRLELRLREARLLSPAGSAPSSPGDPDPEPGLAYGHVELNRFRGVESSDEAGLCVAPLDDFLRISTAGLRLFPSAAFSAENLLFFLSLEARGEPEAGDEPGASLRRSLPLEGVESRLLLP